MFDRALTIGDVTTSIRNTWVNYSSRDIEFHHNEYNLSWKPPHTEMDNEVMMVWDALVMIDLLNHGADVGAAWNECDGWFGKTTGSYDREPSSWGFENFNHHLTDGAGIVTTSSSNTLQVVPLAAKKGNKVELVLVNRSEALQKVLFDFTGLDDLDENTAVAITEAIQSGGLLTKSTTVGDLLNGAGYSLDPYAVTVLTFQTSENTLGNILMERFDGVGGKAIKSLITASAYPNNPSATAMLSSFETPSNTGDTYGVRVHGYLEAPETGDYYFWVAGDDNTQLSISTDESPSNASIIAFHNGWTYGQQWDKFDTQKSAAVSLVQGQRYYIEGLMNEDHGGDHLAVGWRKPSDGNGNVPVSVIPGAVLSPAEPGTEATPTEKTYFIYSESGDDFQQEGGTTGSYAMSVSYPNSGAPEGNEYLRISPTHHYASYTFSIAALDKSEWAGAHLVFDARTYGGFEVMMEQGNGTKKKLNLNTYLSNSGNWEQAIIPIDDFGLDLSQFSKLSFYRLWNGDVTLDVDNIRITGINASGNARKEKGIVPDRLEVSEIP